VRAANSYGAAAPAVPVKDTVKIVQGGVVSQTPDRTTLQAVQTPQVFDFDLLRAALKNAAEKEIPITDDCSVVEAMGMSVKIVEDEGYASQGAFKLLEAIKSFNLDLSGKDTADIGCSNGGFTDVLLRNNVRTVVAIDVAECDLPERILNDKRVHFIQQNARDLTLDKFVEFVCSDVSFISLKHVLPTIHRILTKDGEAVVLIKPQFELDKSKLSKKGIVLAEKDRQHAIDLVKTYALQCGFSILGITTSPIFYENKNIEYLLHIKK
jgi:23S rRNA (cytidine1920-2'-O)/16S rRNA (cytidine1409-2'-O)-methyltransferase